MSREQTLKLYLADLKKDYDYILIDPSGNVKPLKEDMIVTRKLQKCGQLLGIELLDHIIVGGTNGKMLSFREEKMLNVTGRMDWER